MRVQRIGIAKENRLLRAIPVLSASRFYLLAGLWTLLLTAYCGEGKVFAQDASPQTVTDYVTDAEPPPPAKPQKTETTIQPAAGKEAPSQAQSPVANTSANTSASTSVGANAEGPEQSAKLEGSAPEPLVPKTEVGRQTAAMLKLANSLKAEVDKTTKDTLSVTVVREAGEIEQMAHKMRSK